LALVDTLLDEDGETEKALLRAAGGELVEAVLMRYDARNTVCVSTQIGCPIGCSFCATGQSGFVRNLSAGEIVAQVLHFGRRLRQDGQAVTNVVFMGMGEPLLNYDATWRALLNLNDEQGLRLGARRMTLSTAGVVPGILRLADEPLEVGLAVSLHAPYDALRDELVPLNRRYPLSGAGRGAGIYRPRAAAGHLRICPDPPGQRYRCARPSYGGAIAWPALPRQSDPAQPHARHAATRLSAGARG
jgi:23S rRNA (adenine2503-C2)-methyltransferase